MFKMEPYTGVKASEPIYRCRMCKREYKPSESLSGICPHCKGELVEATQAPALHPHYTGRCFDGRVRRCR